MILNFSSDGNYLEKHFQLAKRILGKDKNCFQFYEGALKSEIILFHLIENLEKSLEILDKVLNGYNPEKERIWNYLPGNTDYSSDLYEEYVEITNDETSEHESVKINIDVYASLLKSLYHELLMSRYYDNGQIIFQDSYNNGKRHGVWKGWYENGQLEFIGQYKNGLKINEWSYFYPNGQKSRVENYNNMGCLHGLVVSWWDNGQLLGETNYINGTCQENSKMYDRNGKLYN